MRYLLKKKKMCHANISKYNSKHEKQVILLMIEDKAKLHYLVVIKLSASLRKTTTNNGDFYCLNCLHSFRSKNKLVSH